MFGMGDGVLTALQATGQPWLMHLHFMDVHAPYDVPDAYLTELKGLPPIPMDLSTFDGLNAVPVMVPLLSPSQAANVLAQLDIQYRAQMRYWDDQLAIAWARWDAAGVLDDSLVVFWSDHGEQLMEHGETDHGNTLHGEENDVMASFWARNIVPGVWADRTSHMDVLPTLLHALELPIPKNVEGVPAGWAVDRVNIALLGSGSGVFTSTATRGNKRLYYRWNGEKSLYDVEADPEEAVNLYDPKDPDVIDLWGFLAPEVVRASKAYGVSAVDIGP